MGQYSKAEMFNRKAARKQSKAYEILNALDIQPGQTIADIGSGGGFFTFFFSQLVGKNGTVYALDTNQDLLEFINTQATKQGLTNITTVHITGQSLLLPSHSIDLFFVRNVYHHLQDRTSDFSELQHLLTAQGRIAIIEYTKHGSKFSFHRRCGHHVPKETIIEEMSNAGYTVSVSFDFLPVQSFTIFTPKL
jgi:ubiquinone/menaquinone biosynthesis C-methylase UbiE